MPKEEKTVDIDTSGEGAEINIEEQGKTKQLLKTEAPAKEEASCSEAPKQETSEDETRRSKKKKQKKKMINLKITAKVFKQELQNLHVKCVKLKDKEMQPLNMQNRLKKNEKP